MTVYARSDVAAVTISSHAGGCGELHSRPVVEGAPVKLWALTCHAGCEDILRNDPLWASTISSIPETPDEILVREDQEKRGTLEQQNATASALSDLAKLGDLPAAIAKLAQIMAGQHAAVDGASNIALHCKNGHRNGSLAKFCAECGASMTEPVAADRGKELEAPVEVPLEEQSFTELRALAKEMGVKNGRSKDEQLMLIKDYLTQQSN